MTRRSSIAISASEAAADAVRRAILEGKLSPGARLKEDELSVRFGISRTPIREALRVLHGEGLIEMRQHRGAFVRAYDREGLESLYELRGLVEGYGVRIATKRFEGAHAEALRQSCTRFAELLEADDIVELVRENTVFHRTILLASGDQRLVAMAESVMQLPLVYKSYVWYTGDEKRRSLEFHRDIAAAMISGKAALGERLMRRHIRQASEALKRGLDVADSMRKVGGREE